MPTPSADRLPQHVLAALRAVLERTGLSRDTIYTYIRAGLFPRQRRINERVSAWLESEVTDWIRSRPVVGDKDQS
jgi:prophage regulatory protein